MLIREILNEKCWKGYTQKGTKKKGKKTVPNCVKLDESVTFSPSIQKEINGQLVHTSEDFGEVKDVTCQNCNGTGQDHEQRCMYCSGTGKYEEYIPTGPELNVANSNAYAICQMLGIKPDYSGIIFNKDLPAIMRRLVQLKNTNINAYTVQSSISKGPARHVKDGDIDRITTGPTIVDFGRSNEQIMRYINQLMDLVKFAQQNNADISWG